jgi:hypothetical protein
MSRGACKDAERADPSGVVWMVLSEGWNEVVLELGGKVGKRKRLPSLTPSPRRTEIALDRFEERAHLPPEITTHLAFLGDDTPVCVVCAIK